MQIRCYSCSTPFSMNRDAVKGALDLIEEENLKYYNAQCPRCRKANRLSKQQLIKGAPDWKYTPADQADAQEE